MQITFNVPDDTVNVNIYVRREGWADDLYMNIDREALERYKEEQDPEPWRMP